MWNRWKRFCDKKAVMGALLAILAFFLYGWNYDWKTGFLFGILLLAAGFVRIRIKSALVRFLMNGLWALGCIIISCVIPTVMVSDANFLHIGHYRVVMNIVCAAIVYGACLTVSGKIKPAVIAASGILLVLATINGFVFQFRGNEFKPTDIYAAETAWNVASRYVFTISESMGFCFLVWMVAVFAAAALPEDTYGIPNLWIRIGAAAATLAAMAVLGFGVRDIHPNNWSNGGSTENGYLLNFAVGIRDAVVKKPNGYEIEKIEELESQYSSNEPQKKTEELPNLVIIMSESYADVRVLGDGLRTNQSVTPFLDSLQENTVRGYALSPVFGGVTANAEFELLTGASMAFLPEGSVPYQQYLRGDTASLVRLLEDMGYTSFATHPYLKTGWSRTTVYPYLGFSQMTFDEDYPGRELVRDFISDREMYRYVSDRLEQENGPLFLFGITMQNHGDYIYSGGNYQQTISLEGYQEAYPMAEQYLSLLHETDRATEEFLQNLKNFEEKTVVLFFGDHFPQIESSFLEDVHGGTFDTLSEKMLQYTVPFFVWANFDIPERNVPITSLMYLPNYLLESAGVEVPAYYRFLKELQMHIPAINPMGYYSATEGTFLPLEEAYGEEADWIHSYAQLQYNMLFEKEERSKVFFPINQPVE